MNKYLLAWAEMAGMGLDKQRHPVIIELKARATPVRVRQEPGSLAGDHSPHLTSHGLQTMDGGFAEKARPLYEGNKETPNWTWTEPMKQAFQTLRRALLEAPALALPNPNKPF